MIQTAPPFTIHCPSCSTAFPVDPEKVPDEGIAAICSTCMRVFRVRVPEGHGTDIESPGAPDFGSTEAGEEVESPLPELEEPAAPQATAFELPETAAEAEPATPQATAFELPETAAEAEPATPQAADFELPETAAEAEPATPQSVESELPEMAAEAPRAADLELPETAAEAPQAAEPEEDATSQLAEPEGAMEPPPLDTPTGWEDLTSLASDAMAESARGDGESAGQPDGKTLSLGADRFGRRDPNERASRLARVLVSDIIAYHPVRYQESLERRTLREDFQDEIRKSWKEYVAQVGEEMAEGTPYFNEALNEILARGEDIF